MDSLQPSTPTSAVPVSAQPLRPLTNAANTATTLILLALVRELLVLVDNWRLYFTIHDYLAGTATSADVYSATSGPLAAFASMWTLVFWVASGVAFLVWLWRARVNAELIGGVSTQRRSRGWVIGAWYAPVANLWYPRQVVSDIWQVSAPRRPASLTTVNWWWAAFVGAGLVKPIQWRLANQESSLHDVLNNANVSTLLTVLEFAAGVAVILIIRQITAWQNQRIAVQR